MANEENKWTYEAFGDALTICALDKMIAVFARCDEGDCVMLPKTVAFQLHKWLGEHLEAQNDGRD